MFKGLITVAALCLPVAAHASTVSPEVTPTSYAYTVAPTNQGNLGATACGYCDDYYDGSNGELTEDVEAVNFWLLTDANFQAGPNVGWEDDDPVIVFNFAEAISFLRPRIIEAKKALGPENRLTLMFCASLAQDLFLDDGASPEQLREAVEIMERTVRTTRRVFGGAHPMTRHMQIDLANARVRMEARAVA